MSASTTSLTELRPQRSETFLRLSPQASRKLHITRLADLPTEIVILIVSFVHPSDLGAVRLSCRQLNMIASKRTFSDLTSFLSNGATAKRMLESASWSAMMETKSIWSPRCSVPHSLQIRDSWVLAAYAGVKGESWCLHNAEEDWASLVHGHEQHERDPKLSVIMEELGRKVDDEEIRLAFWHFCLYMSYKMPQGAVRSEMPVISAALWR